MLSRISISQSLIDNGILIRTFSHSDQILYRHKYGRRSFFSIRFKHNTLITIFLTHGKFIIELMIDKNDIYTVISSLLKCPPSEVSLTSDIDNSQTSNNSWSTSYRADCQIIF